MSQFKFSIIFLFITANSFAQSISGYVINENNEPVPYANIFVKQLESGTTSDFEGYYYMTLDVGEYDLVFSSLGYESKTIPIIVGDKGEFTNNIYLKSSSIELNEIVVKASKKDPAFEIIQNVIKNKKKYLKQIDSYRTHLYVKATEVIKEKEKVKRRVKQKNENKELEKNKLEEDPFEKLEREKEQEANRLSILEMELFLNYQYPKKYKEERTAYKLHGKKAGLFIPQLGETDFNFYRNMINLKGIAEVPIISPISKTSILSYKYKLIETKTEGDYQVHKIKVIPRKKGNSTCSGFLFINEELWNINRLDLSFEKGALKFYDKFKIQQDYQEISDSLWIPINQKFEYKTKQGKYKSFEGSTSLYYSNYEINYPFAAKFFNNEISFTSQEAYDRDSSYWKSTRPEPLSAQEQKIISYRDSIKAVHESQHYQDSTQAEFNKIKPIELVWDGVGWRNNSKKSQIYIGPIPSLLDWEVIGGWRVGPFISYFRRFDTGKHYRIFGNVDYGFRNKDVQGSLYQRFRYNPMRLADVEFNFGRSFQSVNSFDAFLNQLKPSNYILHDFIEAEHRFEIINGLYLYNNFEWSNRRSVENYKLNKELENYFEEDNPIEFENYQSLISKISLSYTPGQKYMTEPKRKIVLGSKYPTINLVHSRGWNKLFSSDINFDYLELNLEQDITIGVLGNTKYTVKSGKFVNTKDVRFIDVKNFRESDPYLYSSPLNAFQSLDTSLVTTNLFFEVHHIHHFNGALINNIPLIKLLRIRTVVGGGFLWVKDSKIRHQEVFGGIERVFKLGARRRLRLGVYGVLADSNFNELDTAIKFSIDVIDTWKKDWSF